MPRYKLTLEYDGGPYMGWQWQDHGPSIQGAIEEAVGRLDPDGSEVYGSGRTDSGVHALGQVAHVDLIKDLRADKVRDALNHHLGDHPISVLDAVIMPDDWHARFDATERRYLFRILDRRPRLALDRGRVWRVPVRLDADAMHAAAQVLIGQHDFTTFRDAQCQAKSPIKTLDMARVTRVGAEIHCEFAARSFLHKQVRSMVGSLVEVGWDKWDVADMRDALIAKDRSMCGPVSPPDGLYLVSVDYTG
ncbi:MAG: tRNA pseudouridine(38-40) synthase TruA [Pseudomonadota bacterium]